MGEGDSIRFDVSVGPAHETRKLETLLYRHTPDTLLEVEFAYQLAHPAPAWMQGSGVFFSGFYSHLFGVKEDRHSSRDEGGVLVGYHWGFLDFPFVEALGGLGGASIAHNFGEGQEPPRWGSFNGILAARGGVQFCPEFGCFLVHVGYRVERSLATGDGPGYYDQGLTFGIGFIREIPSEEELEKVREREEPHEFPVTLLVEKGESPHDRKIPILRTEYVDFSEGDPPSDQEIFTTEQKVILDHCAMGLHSSAQLNGPDKIFLSAHASHPAIAYHRMNRVRDYLIHHPEFPVSADRLVLNVSETRYEGRNLATFGDSILGAERDASGLRKNFVKLELFK